MPTVSTGRIAGWSLVLFFAAAFSIPLASAAQTQRSPASPWLFAGFKADSKAGVYFATSLDGYHWALVNGGEPMVKPTEPGELMRDPFIQRAPDGSFRMVWTWSWNKPLVIGFSESRDLVTWTKHRELPVMANEPDALNVWAPALCWEPSQKRWLIFWASTIPGRFLGDDAGDNGLNHRIYWTTTKEFEHFTPARVFFNPGYSVIDATILPPTAKGGKFTMIFKDERKTPLKKVLMTATAPSIEGPWTNILGPISPAWNEGAAIIPVGAEDGHPAGYLAYYDHYRPPQHYGALFSPDLVQWSDAAAEITFPAAMRHGSFVRISRAEYDRLQALTPAKAAETQ